MNPTLQEHISEMIEDAKTVLPRFDKATVLMHKDGRQLVILFSDNDHVVGKIKAFPFD